MARIRNVDINEEIVNMKATITVNGPKRFRLKLSIGTAFIRTGMWIMGMKGGVEVEYNE